MKLLKRYPDNLVETLGVSLGDSYSEQTFLDNDMDISDALMLIPERICRHFKYGEE